MLYAKRQLIKRGKDNKCSTLSAKRIIVSSLAIFFVDHVADYVALNSESRDMWNRNKRKREDPNVRRSEVTVNEKLQLRACNRLC